MKLLQFFNIYFFLFFLCPSLLLASSGSEIREDLDEIEIKIKNLLPDSLHKVDSLACFLIDSSSEFDDSIRAMGWYYRAEAAYYSGRFNCSGDYYQRSIELLDSIDSHIKKKAIIYNNLGLTRYFKERYNEALDAFLLSAGLERQIGNMFGFAQCLHNIALVHDKAGRAKSAVTYFDHALDLFFKMDSMAAGAAVCNDYAIHLSGMNKNEAAIEKYSKALDVYDHLGDLEGMAKVKCNIGALYLYEKKYNISSSYLEEALDYFSDNKETPYLINIYSLFGDLYYEKGRTALSVVFYERAERAAKRMGQNNLRHKNLYSLFKALKAEKEYKTAIKVLEAYSELKDSLIIANKAYIESTRDNEIESDLMEKELNIVKAQIREKNLVLIILALLFALGAGGWFLYDRNKYIKNEKEKQYLQQKILRMKMNPHFIFNALSSVQSYILDKNKDEALDYLSDIALLMRQIFDISDTELISLEEELDLQDKYLKVECRRYYQTINCGVKSHLVSGSKFLMVPPLLIRPIIDEIFASGKLRNCQCPGVIISYEQKGNELEISLENKGTILINDPSKEAFGVIEERLKSLQKSYGSGRSYIELVDIFNDGVIIGKRIRLWLPLINNN